MKFDYHFFSPIDQGLVMANFPQWSLPFAVAAYKNWLQLFNKRRGFLYLSQWRNHQDILMNQFCKKHDLEFAESILAYYPQEWEEFIRDVEYQKHMSEYEYHEAQLEDYWNSLRSQPDYKPYVEWDELCNDYIARLQSNVPWPDDSYVEDQITGLWFNTTFNNTPNQIMRLRKLPYLEYLKTPYWRRVRSAMNLAHGARCQHERCDMNDSYWNDEKWIHVHHLTYKNRGNERFTDLTLLCDRCHKMEHGITA